jgi:phosphoribosylanthranilate isomerase
MNGIIQIAGICDQAEADLLMEEGVDWLGFPLRLPVHKEDLTDDDAAQIIRTIRAPRRAVLITYLSRAAEIVELSGRLGLNTVQLHGDVSARELERLRKQAPNLFIIKSLVVGMHTAQDLMHLAVDLNPLVDAFITDTYDPGTGASGATGKIHDWSISRRFVELVSRPLILAGGLNLKNVALAIRNVRPAGVDAHTGVEGPNGRKSRDLVRRFVAEARAAFAGMN